jgi:hypothetical protein
VRDWGHCFIYDEKTLNKSLTKAGFINIKRCKLQQSDLIELSGLENEDRMPEGFLGFETLTLEGEKSASRTF